MGGEARAAQPLPPPRNQVVFCLPGLRERTDYPADVVADEAEAGDARVELHCSPQRVLRGDSTGPGVWGEDVRGGDAFRVSQVARRWRVIPAAEPTQEIMHARPAAALPQAPARPLSWSRPRQG